MDNKIPVFKKKVESFLTNEEGKITKRSMLVAGGMLGTIAAGSLYSNFAEAGTWPSEVCDPGEGSDKITTHCYSHQNSADYSFDGGNLNAQHNHHYNHGSHASHSSHSSHSAGEDGGTI